ANLPPSNTVPDSQTTPQDTALVFSTANGNVISISDYDAGTAPVEVSLSASNGTLTLATTAGLTFSQGTGTADTDTTFSGTLSAINTALNGLTFTPVAGYRGPGTVGILTNDLGNTGAGGPQYGVGVAFI